MLALCVISILFGALLVVAAVGAAQSGLDDSAFLTAAAATLFLLLGWRGLA